MEDHLTDETGAPPGRRPREGGPGSSLSVLPLAPPSGCSEPILSREPITLAVQALRQEFDAAHGGFGPPPRSLPAGALALLLREYDHTRDPTLLHEVLFTLDQMARGGIYDQLAGGFHHAALDAGWRIPSFEKLLCDQALIAPVYVEAYRITGDDAWRRIAAETLGWVLDDLSHPDGGFLSGLGDAGDGWFYRWRPEEVLAVLGPDDGALINRVFDITSEGGAGSVPRLSRPVREWAAELGLDPPAFQSRLDTLRRRLCEARARRGMPVTDQQIRADWNGLAISALSRAADVLGHVEFAEAAIRAADFIMARLWRDATLLHLFHDGEARGPGFLDDYAFLARGLLDLHGLTGEARWRRHADHLAGEMASRFWDAQDAGFFLSADGSQTHLGRSKHPYDGALPAGSSVAADVLVRLAALGADGDRETMARRTLEACLPLVQDAPGSLPYLLAALDDYLDLSAPAAPPVPEVVRADARLSEDVVHPGDPVRLLVRLHLEPGWHVNAAEPLQGNRTPTVVEVTPDRDLTVLSVHYPPPGFTGEGVPVYAGEVEVLADLRAHPDAAPGESRIGVRVRCQPCSANACLPPQELELRVPVRFERE